MTKQQQGLSLITVLVVLLLTLVIVLGTFRTTLFHEVWQGNRSDYQRSFAAAEALLRDAEIDIRGRLPPYTTLQPDGTAGIPCRSAPETTPETTGCRERSSANAWFPRTNTQFDEVRDIVHAARTPAPHCLQGICFPTTSTQADGWVRNLDTLRTEGACYGQYTQQSMRQRAQARTESNPVLEARFDNAHRCTEARAWYWVEAFRYADGLQDNNTPLTAALQPDPSVKVVYRITALARGMKSGTQVVLQSLFVPYPVNQNL